MGRAKRTTTMTSREFNQETSRAKLAAENGPLVVTDRGTPAYVLLTYADYTQLRSPPNRVTGEALADPNYDPTEPDFAQFLPERTVELAVNLFERDE
jgi:hypothetical protein